jgi:anti-anti-sigma factor
MAQKKTAAKKLALTGEVTIFTAAAMKDELLQAMEACESLNVDLSAVTEFDTSGLQLLVSAKKLADEQQTSLQFSKPTESVTSLLKLSGMTALAS